MRVPALSRIGAERNPKLRRRCRRLQVLAASPTRSALASPSVVWIGALFPCLRILSTGMHPVNTLANHSCQPTDILAATHHLHVHAPQDTPPPLMRYAAMRFPVGSCVESLWIGCTCMSPRSPAAPVALGLPSDSHHMIRSTVSTAYAGKMLATSSRHCSTPKVAGREGFEPSATRLTGESSTVELPTSAAIVVEGAGAAATVLKRSGVSFKVATSVGRTFEAVISKTSGFWKLLRAGAVIIGIGDGNSSTEPSPHPLATAREATAAAKATLARNLRRALL